MRRPFVGLVVALSLGTIAGCAGSQKAASEVELTVFAAASLTESFTELGEDFEAEHDGVTVTFNFGPSSGLATQLIEGASADVYASASTRTMDSVVAGEVALESEAFAKNSATIVVPKGNPVGITGVADLAEPGVKLALCAPEVPCGQVAAEVFENSGVTAPRASEEVDVKAVLTKVALGEVDAGITYVTDARANDDVAEIVIPDEVNAETTYPIAALEDSDHADLAADFVELVTGEQGRAVLRAAGFQSP